MAVGAYFGVEVDRVWRHCVSPYGGGSNRFVATNSSRLRKCFFIGVKIYNGYYSVDIQFECLECVAFVNDITEWIKCENMLVMCKGMQNMYCFQQNAIKNITGISLCFWRNFRG